MAALEEEVFALTPGFFWCGGCGTASREITESEANAVISRLHGYIVGGGTAMDAMDSVAWFLEVFARYHYNGTCQCRPARSARPAIPHEGFHLYRLWAEDDRLLYVGVSTRLRARLRSHRRKLGDLIHRVTWEEHPDAVAMLAAEREAIREEYPALNKASVG